MPEDIRHHCSKCNGTIMVMSAPGIWECKRCKDINDEEKLIQARIKIVDCYSKLIERLKYYIDTTDRNNHFIALWIIGTYFHDQFISYPYLFFNAMRGSAKTRVLKFIATVARGGDGKVQNNMTEAVLFRHPRNTVLCIDEVEQIGSKEKQTLRELLNSAYKKGTKVQRMKKAKKDQEEKQVVETFEPYFPIAMANIWGMDEVLGDRSITIILEKSADPWWVKKMEDFDNDDTLKEIKRTLSDVSDVSVVKKHIYQDWNNYIHKKYMPTSLTSLTTLTTLTTLTSLTTSLQEEFFLKIDDLGIFGRNLELFMAFALLSKEILDEEIIEKTFCFGKEIFMQKVEDEYAESKDVMVYDFIAKMYNDNKEYIPIKKLTSEFRLFSGDEGDENQWINEKWFGKALKRLNLVSDKRRIGSSGTQVQLNFKKAQQKILMFGVRA